ncbi:MAG TPA: glycosyltransferase [Nanoarchaeota archaeon]|nr:glycosyltransferase [Nanoarchaeota archaeon]
MQIPKITKEYSVSCVVPCYNEEVSIGKTIEMLAKNGYSGLKKIIVVDDRSTDRSYEIIKKYEKKYYSCFSCCFVFCRIGLFWQSGSESYTNCFWYRKSW